MLLDILSWFFILAGSGFLVIGGVGLLRFPDVFTRMHAAGMVDTLALTLLIIGMAVQSGLSLVTVKLFLILLFMFFASPTSTHALAKASLDGGVTPEVDEDQLPDDPRVGAQE